MGKGTLKVGMLVLCTEAERAAIVLRRHPHALPPLTALGYPADGPQRLTALATCGREAYTAAGRAAKRLQMLQAEGRDLALELYALHKRARRVLRVVELHDDPDVTAEAHSVRASLTLRSPRLQAGLDGARHLRDVLGRPGTPLAAVPGIPRLRDEARQLTDQARDVVARIQHAEAERRRRTRAVLEAKEALRDGLRHLRDVWLGAQAFGHPLPDLIFELVRRANASEDRGSA